MNKIEVVKADGLDVVLRVASAGERDLSAKADAVTLIQAIADMAGLTVTIEGVSA